MTQGANPTATLAYDANGNLTGDGTWTFAYDAENKMTQATKTGTTATYAHDPLLRRQGKTVNGATTTFLLDGAEEIGDYDAAGAMLRRYVPSDGTDAPIAMIEGTGGGTVRKWFHRSRIGSTIAMSDGAGAVSEGPITYDPFGSSASTGGVPFKFTGRRLDVETGLYYYRARYYSPSLGRFMQTDPIGTCDDINLYAYVDNDPLNATDPMGLKKTNPIPVEKITVIGDRPPAKPKPTPIRLPASPFNGGSQANPAVENKGRDQTTDDCGDPPRPGCVEKVLVTAKRRQRLPQGDLSGSGGGGDYWTAVGDLLDCLRVLR